MVKRNISLFGLRVCAGMNIYTLRGVAYNQKVIEWIAKAQEKFEEYSPENFGQKVEAVNARRRAAQNKQARGKQN